MPRKAKDIATPPEEKAIAARVLSAAQLAEEKGWLPPVREDFDCAVSLVLSQRIPFAESRAIRRGMYAKVGKSVLEAQNMQRWTDEDWFSVGLTDSFKIKIIRSIVALALEAKQGGEVKGEPPAAHGLTSHGLSLLCGIGPWTIKGWEISTRRAPDLFLQEDKWIRFHLKTLFKKRTMPSESVAAKLAEAHWKGHRSLVTRFLWRLEKQSATKLLSENGGINLAQADFVPYLYTATAVDAKHDKTFKPSKYDKADDEEEENEAELKEDSHLAVQKARKGGAGNKCKPAADMASEEADFFDERGELRGDDVSPINQQQQQPQDLPPSEPPKKKRGRPPKKAKLDK